MPDTAIQEMRNTKKQYFKTEGIQCFHGVQSFVKGEVTPEQAHKIGMELANEYGKRFYNTKQDYAMMRKISDRLCREYGLDVLKQEEKYNKYATSSVYKEVMKDVIDYAIASAKDYNEFIRILNDLDYIVIDRNENLSVRREPYKRNTRIERQFGKNYSKENIYKRILETQLLYPYSPDPYLLINRTCENYNKQKEKHYYKKGSIGYLIFQYEKLLGINTENVSKPNITKMTPELIAELKKMDELSNQAKFLAKYNINTEQELLDFEKKAYEKVNPLKSQRENLWKKHNRTKTEDKKKEIENEIIEISKQITPLTEEIRHCNNIMQRMEKIKQYKEHQRLKQEKAQFEKEQDKKTKARQGR